jgi:hypothetical protein
MSLMQEVTDLVNELGEVSGDALLPYLPNHSREKVFQALQNARYTKKIRLVRRGQALGLGGTKGSQPGVYGPVEEVDEPPTAPSGVLPVNSVFQLGERAGAAA